MPNITIYVDNELYIKYLETDKDTQNHWKAIFRDKIKEGD